MEDFNILQDETPIKSVEDSKIVELTPELLEVNFLVWEKRLKGDLEAKHPDNKNRESRVHKAREFIEKLPLYNCMRLGGVSFFADNPTLFNTKELRLRTKSISDISASGTNKDDMEYGRDRFIFLKYGHAMFAGNDRLAVAVNPAVLSREGTLVALEDLSMIRFREQAEDGSLLDWNNAWEQQKKEIWTGVKFKELFPYFLALSFDDPQEYYSRPLNPNFYKISRNGSTSKRDRIASFEIMVPGRIELKDVLFLGLGSESGFYPPINGIDQLEQKIEKPIIKIPKDITYDDLSMYLNGRFRDIIN